MLELVKWPTPLSRGMEGKVGRTNGAIVNITDYVLVAVEIKAKERSCSK